MHSSYWKGMSVAANIAGIKERLGARPVKLIAVTKTASVAQIEEAYAAGVTEFGENRIQDALKKREELSPPAVHANWHFIGHLQTNKVKAAVGQFALIHSVDSLRLAKEISEQASKQNLVQSVLLQVKVVPDDQKGGYQPDQLRAEIADILTLKGLKVEGLMTMAPLTAERKTWQTCFNGLRTLQDELAKTHGVELKELSMGMTNDWEDAVECGSTMVRIGRAIFSDVGTHAH